MTAFVPNLDPNPEIPDLISNDLDVFDDLSIADFRLKMRIDDVVTDERLKEQLMTAMLFINQEISSLLPEFAPTEAQKRWYVIAVYHRCKAYVIEQYRDIDSSKTKHDRADEMEVRIDVYLQRSREALRELLGRSRATIVLI